MKRILMIFVQAAILALLGSALALAFNALRPASFPLVAGQPYMIYKDCPMMPKEAKAVKLADLQEDLQELIVVDARSADEFAKGHVEGARNIPYHPIKSPPADLLEELKLAGPNLVLVVGDTEINSGRLLAAEFAQAGCLGVRYLEGGWPVLVEAGWVKGGDEP